MTRFSCVLALGVVTLLALTLGAAHAAGPHPMDPLTPEEIIGAATILIDGGAAQPGAIFQAIDLREAGFIEHALWVTAFDADERFASGDTPNQNPDEPGLPRYVADNESIVNRDIVLWHTVTFHHVTAAEDYPVLSREHGSFELKPHNFFDRNPALDLRRAPFEVLP